MAKTPAFSTHCIYTILRADKLDAAVSKGGTAEFEESRAWVTGLQLLKKAQSEGQEMAILFGDAADCSELIYWGVLVAIKIKDETTKYTVKQLKQFAKAHTPQELVLRSTKKHIAPSFIRPYAICLRPDFLA